MGIGDVGLEDPLGLLQTKTLQIISERTGEKFPLLTHQYMFIVLSTRVK